MLWLRVLVLNGVNRGVTYSINVCKSWAREWRGHRQATMQTHTCILLVLEKHENVNEPGAKSSSVLLHNFISQKLSLLLVRHTNECSLPCFSKTNNDSVLHECRINGNCLRKCAAFRFLEEFYIRLIATRQINPITTSHSHFATSFVSLCTCMRLNLESGLWQPRNKAFI